ncbi:MAG TPA: hypothetical protein PLN53_10460 [Terricaulis sp.]|nr:hypothetical protein [Terricaulis sp.]
MPFTSTDIREILIIARGETRAFTPSGQADSVAFWLVAPYGSYVSEPDHTVRMPINPSVFNYGALSATDIAPDGWGVSVL